MRRLACNGLMWRLHRRRFFPRCQVNWLVYIVTISLFIWKYYYYNETPILWK